MELSLDIMKPVPTNEDRIWAVIAHLSAIAFGMGILLPIIGWSEQRRKSNYTSFQSLQALGYQSLGYTIWILFSLLIVVVMLAVMVILFGTAGQNGGNIDPLMTSWMIIFFIVISVVFSLYFILPILAAIACALGRDFRYPIMGNRLASYLGYSSQNAADESSWMIEDHEDRWVTAMGHFSILIVLWGMLAPFTALILQGKRSLFLKFQSIQTLVYQAVVNILYFGAVFIYMLGFFFAFVAVTGLVGVAQEGRLPLGLVAFIGFSLLALVFFLLIPLFHVLGQYAGYRVLKGDDYRYPLIGRLVANRLTPSGSQTPMEQNQG